MPLFGKKQNGNLYEREVTNRTITGEPGFQQQQVLQQQVLQQPILQQAPQVMIEPVQIQEKPAVIHERIRKEEVEEIQPIIHRELERLEIHQVTQPMVEQIVQPTQIQERTLAAETRPIISKGVYTPSTAIPQGTQDIQAFHKTVEKPAIIMETERRRVIEEIQPVIYKEILQPTIIRETREIFEKIIEAPIILQETRASQFIGRSQTAPMVTQSFVQQMAPQVVQQRETVDRWVEAAPRSTLLV